MYHWEPTDVRGQLPMYDNGKGYIRRDTAAISMVTLHYTAGPSSQKVRDVAAYQTSNAAIPQTGAGTPFPGLAYTMFVEEDGTVYLAWDLNVRVWHSAADDRNGISVGICYAGNQQPNDRQIVGIGRAIGWCQRKLGRTLGIEGHRDAPYPTACPGPIWPQWKAAVLSNIS